MDNTRRRAHIAVLDALNDIGRAVAGGTDGIQKCIRLVVALIGDGRARRPHFGLLLQKRSGRITGKNRMSGMKANVIALRQAL